jgi:hypothetical protein
MNLNRPLRKSFDKTQNSVVCTERIKFWGLYSSGFHNFYFCDDMGPCDCVRALAVAVWCACVRNCVPGLLQQELLA